MDLSYKNHTQVGYEEHNNLFRQSPDDTFYAKFGNIERSPKDLVEEAIITAQLIKENSEGLPIKVYLSGGIDSEMTATALHKAGIKFSAVIVDYNGTNKHDIKYATDFCDVFGIPYEMPQLNIKKLWENDIVDIGLKYHCSSPQVATFLHLSTLTDGYKLFSTGDVEFRREYDPEEKIYYNFISETTDEALRRFVLHNDDTVMPSFQKFTPEMIAAMLNLPLLKEIALHKHPTMNNTLPFKYEIYKDTFNFKKRTKYNGFENWYDLDAIVRKDMEEGLKKLGLTKYSGVYWTYYGYCDEIGFDQQHNRPKES